MKRMKIMTVFGTRPEAIKMAPLVKALENTAWVDPVVCVTGQHREMLDQVLDMFAITPDYDLKIMKPNQKISEIISNILIGIEEVLEKENPDLVLVHGDTSTTFSAALAAFNKGIQVGHVEAGLRSGDKWSPYPEEVNRQLATRLADIHFAPTQLNKSNLLKENVNPGSIYITGNTCIDALMQMIDDQYTFENDLLKDIVAGDDRLILVTAHRRENLGEPLANIFKAFVRIADANPDVQIVYPIHLNPKVRVTANSILHNHKRIHLIEPLTYKPFANLQSKAHIIMTDSGGIQEEAPALGIPVLVLRTETERPEGVEAGTLLMAGVEEERIVSLTQRLLDDKAFYSSVAQARNPYGEGRSCEQIIDAIADFFAIKG